MTSVTFAKFHPNLIVGGTYSGQIVLWDNRSSKKTPVQRTPLSATAHTVRQSLTLYYLISCKSLVVMSLMVRVISSLVYPLMDHRSLIFCQIRRNIKRTSILCKLLILVLAVVVVFSICLNSNYLFVFCIVTYCANH